MPGGDPHPEAARSGVHDVALGDHAPAVADLDPLARGQPQDVDRVPSLGTVDEELLGVGDVVEEEEGGAVELRDPVVRARHISAR